MTWCVTYAFPNPHESIGTMAAKLNLLLFNLATDRDDPILGFTTEWIAALAPYFKKIFVVTMTKGVVHVPSNVIVYSVGKERGYSEVRRVIRFYKIVGRIIFTEQIDVCFVHMISIFALLFYPFAALRRIPVMLWYCHTATPRTLKLAHHTVNRIVTCSAEGFRLKSTKVNVIGHGINTDIFKPSPVRSPGQGLHVMTVGRLSPIKCCDVLIKAIGETRLRGREDIRFTIVGGIGHADTADYEAYLKRLVEEEQLGSVITFRGAVPFYAVPPLYREADLFLHACNTGGVDKAVLEAMSSGCAVLTSNPAFKKLFGPLAELLFVPENNPKQFAARIIKIGALSFAERMAIGQRLRQLVIENHSLAHLTAVLVRELHELRGI